MLVFLDLRRLTVLQTSQRVAILRSQVATVGGVHAAILLLKAAAWISGCAVLSVDTKHFYLDDFFWTISPFQGLCDF